MTSFVSSPKMRAWIEADPSSQRCAYIIGDPNGTRTQYCTETRTRGAYCDEHADRCYERMPPASGAKFRLSRRPA